MKVVDKEARHWRTKKRRGGGGADGLFARVGGGRRKNAKGKPKENAVDTWPDLQKETASAFWGEKNGVIPIDYTGRLKIELSGKGNSPIRMKQSDKGSLDAGICGAPGCSVTGFRTRFSQTHN